MCDEAPIEGRPGEQIDHELQVDGRRDVAPGSRLHEDGPDRLTATLGQLEVEAREAGVAFRGIHHRGEQAWERLALRAAPRMRP